MKNQVSNIMKLFVCITIVFLSSCDNENDTSKNKSNKNNNLNKNTGKSKEDIFSEKLEKIKTEGKKFIDALIKIQQILSSSDKKKFDKISKGTKHSDKFKHINSIKDFFMKIKSDYKEKEIFDSAISSIKFFIENKKFMNENENKLKQMGIIEKKEYKK